MKGFGIYVKNDLLEPKHYKNMGEAVWLYMWLLDKITSVNENGEGKVLGGKPITYLEFKVDVGVHQNTYSRYIARLREHGYINTIRTPRGMVIVVNKAKKGITRNSDSPKRVIHTIGGSDSHDVVNAEDSQKMSIQYKTKQSRLNNDKTSSTNVLEPKVREYGNPDVNEMFIFWEQTTGFGITSNVKSNRNACSSLIKQHGVEAMRRVITGVAMSHTDQFAPRISDFVSLQRKWRELIVWGKRTQTTSARSVKI